MFLSHTAPGKLLSVWLVLMQHFFATMEQIAPSHPFLYVEHNNFESVNHPEVVRALDIQSHNIKTTYWPPMKYLNRQHRILHVSSFGVIGFSAALTDPIPKKLSNISEGESPGDFMAVFWAHIDLSSSGNITYYFVGNDFIGRDVVNISRTFIGQAFPEYTSFNPVYIFVCTWNGVGYWRNGTDKLNYNQGALATNGTMTFALFLNHYYSISWTAGDDHGGIEGIFQDSSRFTAAVVGLHDKYSSEDIELSGSGTADILNLRTRTNMGVVGVHVYRVDGARIEVPNPCLHQRTPCKKTFICVRDSPYKDDYNCTCQPPTFSNMSHCIYPDPCLQSPCDVNARCARDDGLNQNFSCMCLPPFNLGSGFNCTVLDPCLSNPCPSNSICAREGPLSVGFSCECNNIPYTELVGSICAVPDPCRSNPCDVNAVCTREGLLTSNFVCVCSVPFIVGDGFNCSEFLTSVISTTTTTTPAVIILNDDSMSKENYLVPLACAVGILLYVVLAVSAGFCIYIIIQHKRKKPSLFA